MLALLCTESSASDSLPPNRAVLEAEGGSGEPDGSDPEPSDAPSSGTARDAGIDEDDVDIQERCCLMRFAPEEERGGATRGRGRGFFYARGGGSSSNMRVACFARLCFQSRGTQSLCGV